MRTGTVLSDGPAPLLVSATSCLSTDCSASRQKVMFIPVKVSDGAF